EIVSTARLFLDQVGDRLRRDAGVPPLERAPGVKDSAHDHGVAQHERRRSVSNVVYDYASICDAVTSVAMDRGAPVTAGEFRTLNLTVDEAVASALEAYAGRRGEVHAAEQRARLQELGAFTHELRNALNAALFALEAMKRRQLPLDSRTGRVLERALERLRALVQSSLVDVRLGAGSASSWSRLVVRELFDESTAIIEPDAVARGIFIEIEPSGDLCVDGDRHLLVSALSNLVQNAVKYTVSGGRVWLRARTADHRVVVEVEDRCGGLPDGRAEELFAAFKQMHRDRSGLGLGVMLVQRVVRAHFGDMAVKNLPGLGCVFSVDLPRTKAEVPAAR
ncbi:MAG TPA: HAMP domain-containing sensor histidine kinase, partial [Polyangiaceae bacterium]